MTKKNSLTLFDQLATEILFDIFDYLSSNDIIYTFFYFNQRLNSILIQHQHFLNNFETPKINFDFWQNILSIIGLYIHQLVITTDDFSFSLDLFPNLKYLIISSQLPIYFDHLRFIWRNEQFKKLISCKIKSEIINKESSLLFRSLSSRFVYKTVFNNQNSLQIFEYPFKLSLECLQNIDNLKINLNIRSLSLRLANFTDISSLLEHIPNIKYFNLIITLTYENNQFNKILNLSKIKLEKFCFTVKPDISNVCMSDENFHLLINLIKQFSSTLIYLSLNLSEINLSKTNQLNFNGNFLQNSFLESMIQLKIFHLYVKYFEVPIDIENLLLTFKNSFWFDHYWFIGIHNNYLYTLPFHFNHLNDFIDFNSIQSNNSNILNSCETWYRVRSIKLSENSHLDLNLIKLKMTNLTSIILNFSHNQNLIETKLDRITTVYCQGHFIENLKQWLIYILPNIKHLVLIYSFESITSLSRTIQSLETFDRSIKIESIEIQLLIKETDDLWTNIFDFIKKILKIFKNSKNFIFQFGKIIDYSFINISAKLTKIMNLLNIDENLKDYHMKHIYNYLQLIKIKN